MASSYILLCLSIACFGPLVASVIAIIMRHTKQIHTLVQLLFGASAAFGFIGATAAMLTLITGEHAYASIPLPFIGNLLHLDALSALFLAIINCGSLLAAMFASQYLPRHRHNYSLTLVHSATALFLFGMQLTVLANSVLTFLFSWELMSVAAYFLVIADRQSRSLKAGLLYLVMAHIGVSCLLAALLLLSQGDPTANFSSLHENAKTLSSATTGSAFFLLLAGFGSKAGLVPLHHWLPEAHPQAPSTSSALMSGIMLKIAVYGFLRAIFDIFPVIPASWAVVLLGISLLTAFFGALMAAVEVDVKRLLAWSSIENMGLIFSMIGLGIFFRSHGWSATPFFVAALVHTLCHSIFKVALFLSAGIITEQTNTRDIDRMGGLANMFPLFSFGFLCLALSAAALPPFGTFYGEWLTLQHIVSTIPQLSVGHAVGLSLCISIFALVAGLASFTFIKAFVGIFLSKPRSEYKVEHSHETKVPTLMLASIIGSAGLILLIGLFATQITDVFTSVIDGSPITPDLWGSIHLARSFISPIGIVLLCATTLVLSFLILRLRTATGGIRTTDTWDCGQPLTPRMEYTSTGFAAPIRFFFRSILFSRKQLCAEQLTKENPWILKRTLDWHVSSPWETLVYRPIFHAIELIARTVKKLQNGVIQFYIFLIVFTLVVTLWIAR